MEQTTPWDRVKNQILLGGDSYIREMTERLADVRDIAEIPRSQRYADRPSLAEIFRGHGESDKVERNHLILKAHLEHGYTLKEIADSLDLHYSTISKIISGRPQGNS